MVTTWFPSADRPTEAPFNLEHVKAIQSLHDVSVVHVRLGATAPVSEETYQGVRVVRVGLAARPGSMVRALSVLRARLAGADVLHTMAFSSVLAAAPAWLSRRRPWVHTEHWNGVTNPASVGGLWPRLAWLRHVLRLPNRVTGVTAQLAGELERFSRRGAASVVPCVVNNVRPVVAFPPDKPLRLVAVGGLIPRKRPLLAVQTVEWLRDHGHDVVLHWVGDGPQRAEVEAAIAEAGLTESVVLLGSMPPAEVFSVFDTAHLFFLPTEQENFFTSAAEALSAGRPVVAPLVGGYDDYATPENSVLVPEPSVQALGEAILAARSRFAAVEPQALATPIRERFSPERVARLFDGLYREITGR